MRRRLISVVIAAVSVIGLAGCWQFPHSTRTLLFCSDPDLGWSSNACGISLCQDWARHYNRPYSACPGNIRYGTGPR